MGKFSQHEELIQNSLVHYQELLEGKLREVGEETKMSSMSIVEIEPLAKSIDSRLAMLQNSNAEKLEVLKEQILVENTHRIESFKSEVSTSLVSVSEKNESVEKHIQIFKDNSDKIKNEIQELITKEQEIHQSKLSAIMTENESLANDLKVKIEEQLSVISNNINGQQENLESFNSNMSSLARRVQDIETSDIKQNELLSKMGDQGNNLETKLSSLESADVFLQEAHRMHTEKALDIEKECKRMEQTFVEFYKDQRQEIDSKIKVDINNLQLEKKNSKEIMENVLKRITSTESKLKEMEQYTQNSNERATDLENTVIKYYEQIGVNASEIKDLGNMNTSLENKLQSLNNFVQENKDAQSKFQTDQNEINKGIELQLKAECERFDNVESEMNKSIESLSKQYTEVDNKIVIIINDKFEKLQNIIEGYESKNKEAIKNMQDLADRTSNIEQVIEKKLLTVDDKLTDHSNRLNSLQESNNLQNQKVGNFEGLSDKVNHIEDNIKSFEENYNALMININKK